MLKPEQREKLKATIKNILIDYEAGYYDSPEHARDHILYVIEGEKTCRKYDYQVTIEREKVQ